MCLHFTKDHEGNKISTPYPEKTNTPYSSYRRLAHPPRVKGTSTLGFRGRVCLLAELSGGYLRLEARWRSQAPEKVTMTDLFYLRWMEVDSVNLPYLLARYLRLFASGRKQGAMISGDMALPPRNQRHQYLGYEGLYYTGVNIANFETKMARIFKRQSVLTRRSLRRLFDIRGPLVYGLIMEFFSTFRFGDAAESRRRILDKGDLSAYGIMISSVGDFLGTPPLYSYQGSYVEVLEIICFREEAGAMISGGQFVARLAEHFGSAMQEGDARGVAEEALVAPEEDEVHGICEALQGQREVLDGMAHEFSRFTTWIVTSLAWLMDRAGVPYTRYSKSPIEYQRCSVRPKTDDASTSTAPQQLDP
nr:hypothetical protein [Tanacetum cinerariifolium]